MSYEILKNVPLPTRWLNHNEYPWTELEIGDCIPIRDKAEWRRYRHSAYYHNRKNGTSPRYTTSVRNDVLYIWRVA